MIVKLQQLSITYHKEMQSGRLQSKIMRDVEQVQTLASQIFISFDYDYFEYCSVIWGGYL